MIRLNKQDLLFVGLFTGLAFFLRFFALSEALWSGDAIDFALGLRSYDLSKYQPHPPGYPIYMLFSKLLSIALGDEMGSLRLTSVLFGAFTVAPFFYLAKQIYGKQAAILSAMLLIMNPLHWLMSTRALSDIMGLFFVVLCVYFLYRATNTRNHKTKTLQDLLRASFLLGIALGVRISYFPHLFLWGFVLFTCSVQVKEEGDRIRMFVFPLLTFIGTTLLWGMGQAMVVGTESFFSEVLHFGRGHLMEWGGTVWTHPDLLSRFKELMVQDVMMHGLGGGSDSLRILVTLLTAASVLFYLFKEGFCFRVRFLIWWGLPYLLWVFMGQNLNNPRHILALLPILILMIARGALYMADALGNRLFRSQAFTLSSIITRKLCYACPVILIVSLSVISFKLALNNRLERSSMFQLVDYVKNIYDPAKTIIFCRETRRLFDYYAPQYITVSEKEVDIEGAVAFHSYGQPDVILVTSDLLERWRVEDEEGVSRLKLTLVDRFQHNPYLQNANHHLVLYRLEV